MRKAPERWGSLPLGELHAENTCALCGRTGREGLELNRTVLRMTLAVAHVCWDAVGCERRRYNQRRRFA